MKRRSCASSETSARASDRCRSARCRDGRSVSAVASSSTTFVDVDTIRYSVPHRLVRDHVEVVVEDHVVLIFRGSELVATHARSTEPFARAVDVTHYAVLWRAALDEASTPGLAVLGRDLADYAAVVDGGQ